MYVQSVPFYAGSDVNANFIVRFTKNARLNLIPQSVYARAQKKCPDTHAHKPLDRIDVTANLKSYRPFL